MCMLLRIILRRHILLKRHSLFLSPTLPLSLSLSLNSIENSRGIFSLDGDLK